MDPGLPRPRLSYADIGAALRNGRAMFADMPTVSIAYASIFTLFGLIVLIPIAVLGFSPLILPLAGGFMLLGPVLLTGYFELAGQYSRGASPRLSDAFASFHRAPMGLWLVALVCAFLFMVWITDAGVLYSFTVGGERISYDLAWVPELGGSVLSFELWGSLMGSVIAYMIFAVSAFSVPLIYERRCDVVQGIQLSARTVVGNFHVCLVWGLVLGVVIVLSILLLPLLLLTLPVMSYASFAIYRRAFPLAPKEDE
jgi:uncharacterized membrane protein